MNIVCEVCGVIGFKHLLLCCRDCRGSAIHQYCLDKVIFNGSLVEWWCYECQQRSGEVTCCVFPKKVSSERPSDTHSGWTLQQSNTTTVESERPSHTHSGLTLQQRSMVATVTQQSTLQDDAMDEVMPCSPNMCILAKENIENQNRRENQSEPSILPSAHIENQSRKENQSEPSNLFDQAHSSLSLETYLAKFLPVGSTVEVKTSVEFVKDNPRKRRRLILLDDDDEEKEKAEDVQPEHVDPPCQKCDTAKKNNEIEKTVRTRDLSNSNPSDGGPVKKRRRYIDANEDEDDEAVIDVVNASCAKKDVPNCALNDGANLGSQTAVAKDHSLRSSVPSGSITSDQYYIYSRPLDEPVWSGALKINSEVFHQLDAYLSNKACQKVWDLSRMLQPVVEVTKLPRLQAWPRKWMSAAPTDDCIGLFFFPHSSRPNEESNKLVNKIIESDDALKVTIGVAELLIFPSCLLPEQSQLFQGKYYLWGVFKRIKDKSNRGVLVREQDGVACATEECNLREQHLLYQQDDIRCESSGQETSDVKHVMDVENEIVAEHNCLSQKVAMKIAKREGGITLCDSKLPFAKPNSAEDGSNCSLHPRIDHEFHAPEEMNQHEEYLSSPLLNASSVAKSTSECSHGGFGPPTKKLFGLVTAETPRVKQLIQEMISEGESRTDSNVGVGSGLNPGGTKYQHLTEHHPQCFDFMLTGNGVPDVGSESCLELFPVQQENIGWAPRVEGAEEVDIDLSLGARSRAPSVHL